MKGNLQVSAAGLPADFATRAWEQWHDHKGPFNRVADKLVLVTLGTHQAFDPAWREVKNAGSGTDIHGTPIKTQTMFMPTCGVGSRCT